MGFRMSCCYERLTPIREFWTINPISENWDSVISGRKIQTIFQNCPEITLPDDPKIPQIGVKSRTQMKFSVLGFATTALNDQVNKPIKVLNAEDVAINAHLVVENKIGFHIKVFNSYIVFCAFLFERLDLTTSWKTIPSEQSMSKKQLIWNILFMITKRFHQNE